MVLRQVRGDGRRIERGDWPCRAIRMGAILMLSREAVIDEASNEIGLGRSALMRRLRRVDVVVFDCDSTLSSIEGIDELASGSRAEVAALTDAAMRGDVPLEEVYGRRLAVVRPTQASVEALGARYIEHTVPDAADVVRALQDEGIKVRIMSGGLLPAVLILATHLGIRRRDVAAVDVSFDEAGGYTRYDESSPLARAGGKRELLEIWRRESAGSVMFVGDGITDLETRDVADLFVAYAGVVERAEVVTAADIVVRSSSLAPVLALALGGQPPRLPAWKKLYDQGLDQLEAVYRSYLGNGPSA